MALGEESMDLSQTYGLGGSQSQMQMTRVYEEQNSTINFDSPTKSPGKYLDSSQPQASFPFEEKPIGIFIVNQELAADVVAIQFSHHITIFTLKEGKLTTVQTCHAPNDLIDCLTLGQNSIIVGKGGILNYAFTTFEKQSSIYFVADKGNQLRENFTTYEEDSIIQEYNDESLSFFKLAMDGEKGELIAALTDSPTCVVIDVLKKKQKATFILRDSGIGVCWHKSDPLKLLVAERSGWVKMFNVIKQTQILSINLVFGPLTSVDWSPLNSFMVGLGTHNGAFIVDLSKLNTGSTYYDVHSSFTRAIKFSTQDPNLFTTFGCPDSEVKIYQQKIRQPLWILKKKEMHDACWMYGTNDLLVLCGKELLVFNYPPT